MRPGPVGRAAAGALSRRRLQTVVIGLVLLVSCAASVLALGLVVESQSPFARAFTAQRGADVTAAINPARVSGSRLASTGRLPGVIAAAGPFRTVLVSPRLPVAGPGGVPMTLPGVTIVGRSAPGGPVDDLILRSGHWPTSDGQIVLDSGQSGPQFGVPLGTRITFAGLRGKPALTVVGTANSVTGTAFGWVLPAEIARLGAGPAAAGEQMLYRFAAAGGQSALSADLAEVTRALPAGAVAGTQNYLAARSGESGNTAPFVPFLVAFGVLGMLMSALITANVISGAVVAGYRRIGVLKSIGFTPGQVVTAYAGQVLVSALAGCAAGVVLGNVLAIPVLAQAASVYQIGALHVPIWVDVAVPAAMCLLVAVAAVLPALRAGRLSAVQAIATGRAPRTGRGYTAHRLLGRLPLPRPVTIGLASPFARPARTAMTMAAVLLGATAVTLAVGLTSSLHRVVTDLSHSAAIAVRVQLPGVGPGGIGVRVTRHHCTAGAAATTPAGTGTCTTTRTPVNAVTAQRAVESALRTQPGTARYVQQSGRLAAVAGLSQPVMITAFRGDAAWTGYDMVTGHWYAAPDQVDAATGFLTSTGTRVGDMVTLVVGGRRARVRIVGQYFGTENNGLALVTGWQTLARLDPALAPAADDIALTPGTPAAGYARSLQSRLGSVFFVLVNQRNSDVLDVMIALIGTLTLLLAIVAGLGVLNTVVLNTRERVHDLGVFKVVGMTPRQTSVMAVCWVAGVGLVGGLIAVPVGIALHGVVLAAMTSAADVGLPPDLLAVYRGGEVVVLALAGAAIACGGALLPAGWAAAIRPGAALRSE